MKMSFLGSIVLLVATATSSAEWDWFLGSNPKESEKNILVLRTGYSATSLILATSLATAVSFLAINYGSGSIKAIKKLWWSDEWVIDWIKKTLTQFTEIRYRELLAREGLADDNDITSLRSIGQTAALTSPAQMPPLHTTKHLIESDLRTLSQILVECVEQNLIRHDFFDQALMLFHLLEKKLKVIVDSDEYKKETAALETQCRQVLTQTHQQL